MPLSRIVLLSLCLLSPLASAHLVDPNELKLPADTTQYDFKVIEGKWDNPTPEPTPAPQAAPPSEKPVKKAQNRAKNVNSVSGPTPTAASISPVGSQNSPSANPETANISATNPPQIRLHKVLIHYLIMGFQHILPEGTDHILFVLGLFFFSTGLRQLALQISVFTLAHTVTLILSTLHIASLPSSIVEPIIAASIVFVAIENLYYSQLTRRRLILIFCFGLLHGMGFAGALAEAGLPKDALIPALLSFNVGVEVGQLTVVALAFLAVAAFRKATWYRQRIVVPASLAIAAIGAFWTVNRVFFGS